MFERQQDASLMEESEQVGGDVKKVIREGGQIPSSSAVTVDQCINNGFYSEGKGSYGKFKQKCGICFTFN